MGNAKLDPQNTPIIKKSSLHTYQQASAFISPVMLNALNSSGVGRSSGQVIAQLQQIHGNQRTLQLLRRGHANVTEIQKATSDKRVIQLDRLVEIQTGVDKKDFNATRSQVEASLGISSSGIAYKNPKLLAMNDPSEVLYLWGHMDNERIGDGEFNELAQGMVDLGFRTCKEIRLIGCNNQDTPTVAPQTFWHALQHALSKIASSEESGASSSSSPSTQVTVPTIHATKGPLHSSTNEGFEKGWWVGTPSKKENELKQDQSRILRYMTDPNYHDDNIGELQNMVGYYSSYLNFRPEPANNNEENLKTLHKYFEEERISKQTSLKKKGEKYPTLMQEVEGEGGTKTKVWNPDAWVSYSG